MAGAAAAPGCFGVGTGWQEKGCGLGDGPGGCFEPEGGGDAPNIFAKRASLYTQMAMLTAVVEMNFAGPGVTVE